MTRVLTIAAGVLLASQLAACGGSGTTEAHNQRIEACATGTASFVLQGNGIHGRATPGLLRAAESLCRDADTKGALKGATIQPDERLALLRKHATSLYAPICDRLAATVRKATPTKILYYLTDDDFSGYANGFCAVVADYVHEDASFDARLFSDHPDLLEPFCAATSSWAISKQPQSDIPRNRRRAYGRTLCRRLVRERLLVAKGAVEIGYRPGAVRVLRETASEFAEP